MCVANLFDLIISSDQNWVQIGVNPVTKWPGAHVVMATLHEEAGAATHLTPHLTPESRLPLSAVQLPPAGARPLDTRDVRRHCQGHCHRRSGDSGRHQLEVSLRRPHGIQ